MRLSKVITPEIIMGTRGDPRALRMYKDTLKEISGMSKGALLCGPYVQRMEQPARVHFAQSWKFRRNGGGKVYQVGKEFAQALSEVDREIPRDLLKNGFFAYFSFPDGTFMEPDGENVRGGFVYIGHWSEVVCHPLDDEVSQVIWASYDCDTPQASPTGWGVHVGSLLMSVAGDDFVRQIEKTQQVRDSSEPATKDVFRALVNLAVYVNTPDAVLLPVRPVQQTTNRQRREIYDKHGAANHCTVPVTFVSWAFQRPRQYGVDSTTVKGHFRWQRCGPGFLDAKLIWIEEHARHFKTGDSNEATV